MNTYIAIAVCIVLGLIVFIGLVSDDSSILKAEQNAAGQAAEQINDRF